LLFDVDADSGVVGLATGDRNRQVARVGDRTYHAIRPERLAPRPAANTEWRQSELGQGVACRRPTERETHPPTLRGIRPKVLLLERMERWNALRRASGANANWAWQRLPHVLCDRKLTGLDVVKVRVEHAHGRDVVDR
jgi:hypothetical protein